MTHAALAQEGREVFAARCTVCHGDGHGTERGPNLANSRRVRARSVAELLAVIRDGIPADVVVEEIDIDVEEVLAWCNVQGLPMNASSRSRFVSERVRQKHETS